VWHLTYSGMHRWDRLALEAMVTETKLPRCISAIVVEYAHQFVGWFVSASEVYCSAIVKPHKSLFAMAFVSGGWLHVADKAFEPHIGIAGDEPCSLLALQNGGFVSGTKNGNIHVWNPATVIEKQWNAGPFVVRALAELPNNLLAVGGFTGIFVFNLATRQPVAKFNMHRVQTICVLRTGTILAGCAHGRICFLQFANNKLELVHEIKDLVREIKTYVSGITALADCCNGKFVSASIDKRVCMWDYRGTMLNEIDMRKMSPPVALAVLPDGRLVVGCDDERVFVWDLDTWEHWLTLSTGWSNFSLLKQSQNLSLVVLADNKLVCASSSLVTVWE